MGPDFLLEVLDFDLNTFGRVTHAPHSSDKQAGQMAQHLTRSHMRWVAMRVKWDNKCDLHRGKKG